MCAGVVCVSDLRVTGGGECELDRGAGDNLMCKNPWAAQVKTLVSQSQVKVSQTLTGMPIRGMVMTNLFFIRFITLSSAKNHPLVS